MSRKLMIGAVTGCAFLIASGAAFAAESVRSTSWVGPKHPTNMYGYTNFIKRVEEETGGELTFKHFEGGALLGATATLGGLSDGVADMGMVANTYHPAELPNQQLVADIALLATNAPAVAAAVAEYNILHCGECIDEYNRHGVVYTGTYSTTPYILISPNELTGLDSLAGKKMRSAGSVWDRWTVAVGGVPVNVPSTDMYEGLSRGALDIAIQAPSALRNFGLWDVAKHVTMLPLGTYHSLALVAINQQFWDDRSPEQREILWRNAAKTNLEVSLGYIDVDAEVLAEAQEDHGVTVHEPPSDMVEQLAQFREQDLKDLAEIARNKYGIENPEEKIAKLSELITSWTEKFEPVHGDLEKMSAMLMEDVYSKIDLATWPKSK